MSDACFLTLLPCSSPTSTSSLLPLLACPRAVQASTCKQGRNRGAARAQDHPEEHRLGAGRAAQYPTLSHLGSAPTGWETPAKGASSDLMVCLYTWQQPGNIAHVPSKPLAFTNCTNHAAKLAFILANHYN